jgi:hypothetical protein
MNTVHCYTLAIHYMRPFPHHPPISRTYQLTIEQTNNNDQRGSVSPNTHTHTQLNTYFLPPFFLEGTTLKLPLAGSSLGVSGLGGPFLATSLQPPGAALAGLPLLGGVDVSTRPLSASLLRRMNSSAKWRESMVLLLPWTASVMSSASAGKKMRSATNCSAVKS